MSKLTKYQNFGPAFGLTALIGGLALITPTHGSADELLEKTRVDNGIRTAAAPPLPGSHRFYGDPLEKLSDRIILIQAALVSRGCFGGAINGVWDADTQEAARLVARVDGLNVSTHEPTAELVEALLVSETHECNVREAAVERDVVATVELPSQGERPDELGTAATPLPVPKPEGEGRARVRTASLGATSHRLTKPTPEERAAASETVRKYKEWRSRTTKSNSRTTKRRAKDTTRRSKLRTARKQPSSKKSNQAAANAAKAVISIGIGIGIGKALGGGKW